MTRDVGRYLELRADLRRVLPLVTLVDNREDDWYSIIGSAKRGVFTKAEYELLKLAGLTPYQDTCEATSDEIHDAIEKLLKPCTEE